MTMLLIGLTEEQRIYLMLISNLLLEIYSILFLVKIISYEEIEKSNNKFVKRFFNINL